MIVDDEQRAFLDGLQVGDLVVVARSWRDWRVNPIDKPSYARVWIAWTQFDRRTGREWGSATSSYRKDLLPLTLERIESARIEVEQQKERSARNVLMASIVQALDGAPVALLERIRAMLSDPNALESTPTQL